MKSNSQFSVWLRADLEILLVVCLAPYGSSLSKRTGWDTGLAVEQHLFFSYQYPQKTENGPISLLLSEWKAGGSRGKVCLSPVTAGKETVALPVARGSCLPCTSLGDV